MSICPERFAEEELLISAKLRGLCLAAAVAITALLFYLGAQPFAVNLLRVPWDKLVHFLVFGSLALLLWTGAGGRMPLLVFGMVSAIGALDEWHQAGLPGRSMDFGDWLTDMAAAALAITVLQTAKNRSAR